MKGEDEIIKSNLRKSNILEVPSLCLGNDHSQGVEERRVNEGGSYNIARPGGLYNFQFSQMKKQCQWWENRDAKRKGESDEHEVLGHVSDFQEHEDISFSIRKNKSEHKDRFIQSQERVGDNLHAIFALKGDFIQPRVRVRLCVGC